MHLPPFHAMGVIFQYLIPLMSGLAVALYPPQSPEPPVVPSIENVVQACRTTRCTALISVPSMIEVCFPGDFLCCIVLIGYANRFGRKARRTLNFLRACDSWYV